MEDNKKFISIVKELYKKYPRVINKKTLVSKSIIEELQKELQTPLEEVHKFYRWYTGISYKLRVVEGAKKYNLKGEVVGVVSKTEFLKIQNMLEQQKMNDPQN